MLVGCEAGGARQPTDVRSPRAHRRMPRIASVLCVSPLEADAQGGRPQASRLLAGVCHSVPDLLGDLIEVPALWALEGRELLVAFELLEPELLAERQHVPVVDVGCHRPGERASE